MSDEPALAHLDAGELENLLDSLRQGDIIRLESIPALLAPDYSLYPKELEGAPRDEALVTASFESPTGLGVLVSQDCELGKLPANEGWLTVAPLKQVEDDIYKRAAQGRSTRYFAYPELEDKDNLAVDAGMLLTLEKTALLSPRVERIKCPLAGPEREALRSWLGRRLGRYAFPNEIQRGVVDKIAVALDKVAKDPNFERVLKSVIFYGLRYTEENAHYSFLALFDPALLVANKVDEALVEATKKKVFGALATASKETHYSPEVQFETADEFPSSKFFTYSAFEPGP